MPTGGIVIKFLSVLLGLCLLCGCVGTESHPSASPMQTTVEQTVPSIYTIPSGGLTIEETVHAYFEQQYRSYTTFQDIDLSAILDTSMPSIQNSVLWTTMLNQRRRLLKEMDLCYVEAEQFAYTIRFLSEDELTDGRLAYWDARQLTAQGEVLVHFVIEGEAGCAYPPIMAVNTQHTMRFYQEDGVWKLVFHYFPGAVRKFMRENSLRIYSDEEMRRMLKKEFAAVNLVEVSAPPSVPQGAMLYQGEASAAYAQQYTESVNPAFYFIGDWIGDCANFTSQCIWKGFSQEAMSDEWYAGAGGGSPAWENVGYFWEYATSNRSLIGQEIGGIDDIRQGDILQTSALGISVTDAEDDQERFNHSLILVEPATMRFAQHSPGCFVYYSDLVNVKIRIFRPLYFSAGV